MVERLDAQSQGISEKIENELRRQFPPYVSVQANIRIEEGSVVVAGTVMLLSWGGSIVFDAAKEEVERLVSGLVKSAIQRAIAPFLSSEPILDGSGRMEFDVRPAGRSISSLFTRPRETQYLEGQITEARSVLLPSAAPGMFRIRGLAALVLLIFALQVAFIVDRFFEVHPRASVASELSSVSADLEHSAKKVESKKRK